VVLAERGTVVVWTYSLVVVMGSNIPTERLAGFPTWLGTRIREDFEDKARLLGQLSARWKSITGIFLVVFAVGSFVILNLQKKFTAEAVLILDPRRNTIVEGVSALTGMQWDTVAVNTEVSMLRLPELIARVVEKLDLISHPEYGVGQGPGLASTLLSTLGIKRDNLVALPPGRREQALASATVQRNLRVVNEPRTYTIRILYTSPDPIHATTVANAIAELHIAAERDARIAAIRDASEWLHREIDTLRERVVKAEEAELAYRKERGLGDERVTSAAQQEVNALAMQVTLASSERAQAEARLQQVSTGVMSSLEEAVNVAIDRENNVRQQLKEAQSRLDDVLAAEAGLRAVMRETAASRVLLEDFLRRARSADSQLDAPRPEARIGSRALVPVQPSGLPTSYLMAAVLLGSLVFAVGMGVLMVKLRKGFRSLEEIEDTLGVEAVGEIPKVAGGARGVRRLISEDQTSPVVESVRSICARLRGGGHRSSVILVTSPAPGDGKTVLASTLAQIFAQTNQSCLFVDADFRRPSGHRIFNLPSQPGLCEVLAGTLPLEKALIKLIPGPLTFMSAGEVVREPLELLSPHRLTQFFEAVRQKFDVIIMDSPPLLPVSDASLLVPHVTHVLLAVRWNVTTRSAAARAIMILKRQAAPPPLLALTQVDQKKTSKYEEGRYGMDLSYRGRAWTHNVAASGRK
jgi:succinoglycan biosynthesis transport protein ExoP